MNHFSRVLKIAFRRYWAVLGVVGTSFVIAMLWGANIGVLFPMVEIVFKGDSLPSYVANEIRAADEKIVLLGASIKTYDEQLAKETIDNAATLRTSLTAAERQRMGILEAKPDASESPADIRVVDGTIQAYRTMIGDDSPLTRQVVQLESESAEARVLAAEASAKTLTKIQPWVNEYMPGGPFGTLVLIVGFLLVATGLKLVALTINLMLVQYVSERATIDIRSLFFRKSLHLDLDAFGDNGSAELTSRLTNDTANISGGVSLILGRCVREPLKMIVCVGSAAYICPRLLLLVMVVTPLIAFVMHKLSRSIRRASRRAMEEMSMIYGMLNDAFAGIRVVKAFNTQASERAKFRVGITAYYRKSMKMAFYNSLARSTSEMMGMTVVGLAILAGGYLVVNQETHLFGLRMCNEPMDVATILMFFGFLIGASDPARKLSDVWSGVNRGIAAAERVYQIIDKPVRVSEPKQPLTPASPHASLSFNDVHYQYPSGPTVLRGINLQIPHGETVAMVGPNGCGKSTLVSLLCRFDDPQQGSVLFDDTPLDQMRTRDVRRRLALVTQRTVLFDDTIENNIRYGSPGADAHDVVRAAKQAFADDFIRRKTPDGYKTMLGSAGMRLSGGQMQRIALARAFLRNPDILILDEATSQIDLESEQLIHEALSKFLVGRTGIMITHRASSLALADRIIVIENGAVVDQGRHEQLVGCNRFYQSLCGNKQRKSA